MNEEAGDARYTTIPPHPHAGNDIGGAMGTPIVATTEACRGIDVEDGENILIADHPDDFAAKTLRLLREPELRERLSRAGRARVEERYSWRSSGQDLEQIFREIVAAHTLR